MKKAITCLLVLALVAGIFAGCNQDDPVNPHIYDGTQIELNDTGITVDGNPATTDSTKPVYVAKDIVYYEEGHDFTYGEGAAKDAHSLEEASAHTVVHITQPGQYILSGKLSKGQIAVDLGEDADDNPNAVVTLVLNGVDITCEVAPAIIFYNVYECGSKDEDKASASVDTAKAGANIVLADDTTNTASGAYVAKIYKPDTVELSEDGTEVVDAKKLHKYDGAVYSKMSMNINGGGTLNIHAANEGLDSELHLTINGGNININSGNDGINTNEDNVSVTTINGGNLNILVNGSTGEGDGIDSNGYLVINGGTVTAQACAISGDAGIDSDCGIHINGGTVFASGNMLDRISESKQNYAVFQFAASHTGGIYTLKNEADKVLAQKQITNKFTYLIISTPDLAAGNYTLWQGDTQLQGIASGNMGGQMHPGQPPEGEQPGGMVPPEGMEPPEGMTPPEGEQPDSMNPPDGQLPPEGMEKPGDRPGGGQIPENSGEASTTFPIREGGNYFVSVREAT